MNIEHLSSSFLTISNEIVVKFVDYNSNRPRCSLKPWTGSQTDEEKSKQIVFDGMYQVCDWRECVPGYSLYAQWLEDKALTSLV